MGPFKKDNSGAGKPKGNTSFFSSLYRQFTSIKTSVYILGALAFFYLLGTIFPQGGELQAYIDAGGKFVFLVRVFTLLDVFSSPLFLVAAFLLLINLCICVYERYKTLFTRRVGPPAAPNHTLCLTQDYTEAQPEVRRVFREELGFRLVYKDDRWVTMEKGIPWKLFTWLYHAGIIICFIGFFTTYLFAYEDTITLWPGKATPVEPSTGSTVAGLLGSEPGGDGLSLVLDEFTTEYYHTPSLEYPEGKISRLAMGLGWNPPTYEITDKSYFPKEWTARVRVIEQGEEELNKAIELNDPLKYGGYTFYLMNFKQVYKVKVDDNPLPIEAEAGHDVVVPGVEAPLKFGSLKAGTLYRLDNVVEDITPFTTVSSAGGDDGYEDLGRVELGEAAVVEGRRVKFAGFEEGVVLSYRYDPGVPILLFGGILIVAFMAIRIYGGWYRATYRISEADGIATLEVFITTRGLWADREKLAERLDFFLTRDDLRPSLLPED